MENNDSIEALFASYKSLGESLEKTEQVVASYKDSRREIAKEMHTRFGKGPFTYEGEKYVITVRLGPAGQYYLLSKAPNSKRAPMQVA